MGGVQVKLIYQMGIGTLGGGDSFEVGLQNSVYKNSEYESQTKKMIQIVISTISHVWFPTLTTFWQSVFVSLYYYFP